MTWTTRDIIEADPPDEGWEDRKWIEINKVNTLIQKRIDGCEQLREIGVPVGGILGTLQRLHTDIND